MDAINFITQSYNYSLLWSASISHGQLFVKNSNTLTGIHSLASTIASTPNLQMSPAALPPDPSIMNIMVVKENERNRQNRHEREDDDTSSLHQELQLERLPKASALSTSNSIDAFNKTILSSSSKDSLISSNSVKSSPYKGKLNRDHTLEYSKGKANKITSKMKGNKY